MCKVAFEAESLPGVHSRPTVRVQGPGPREDHGRIITPEGIATTAQAFAHLHKKYEDGKQRRRRCCPPAKTTPLAPRIRPIRMSDVRVLLHLGGQLYHT